jgi:hypothetical protein
MPHQIVASLSCFLRCADRLVRQLFALCYTGGKVGLIDYGQSKQLPDDARIAFAKLVVAMDKEDKPVGQDTTVPEHCIVSGLWHALLVELESCKLSGLCTPSINHIYSCRVPF